MFSHLIGLILLIEVCARVYETASANPPEAARILIDGLMQSREPGWYQMFLEALEAKGILSWLVTILKSTLTIFLSGALNL